MTTRLTSLVGAPVAIGAFEVDPITTGSINAVARQPSSIDRLSLSAPVPITGGSVGVSLVDVLRGPGDRSRLLAASYSQPIGRYGSLSINAFTDLAHRKESGFFASFSMPLGGGAVASVGAAASRNSRLATFDASKPLGPEPGSYGWRVRDIESRAQSYRSAAGSYRAGFARAEITAEQIGRGGRVSAEVDGAIAATTAGVFLSNRISDGFAVVNVGAPGVKVFHENELVGTTGSIWK